MPARSPPQYEERHEIEYANRQRHVEQAKDCIDAKLIGVVEKVNDWPRVHITKPCVPVKRCGDILRNCDWLAGALVDVFAADSLEEVDGYKEDDW